MEKTQVFPVFTDSKKGQSDLLKLAMYMCGFISSMPIFFAWLNLKSVEKAGPHILVGDRGKWHLQPVGGNGLL